MFSFILGSLPSAVLADNKGTVVRDPNGTFLSVKFTVTSSAHSTGTVYRTTGLKIWIGPYYAFFDQAYLTSKGFYSSSTTDTVDFTASEIALRSGASVQQIRAAADDFNNGINLGAQIKILQNGVVMATIEEKEQVAPVFNQYGLGAYIAAAETRWGYAYDPVGASRTLTIQIEGQGSTTPAGSKAPGTVHKNMSGSVSLFASPADGWKFAQWVDVTGGIVQFSTNPNTSVYMDKDKTIRAVFIPNTAPPDGKKEYLTVVPCTYTLFEGEYKRFSAFHHKADGSSQEVTNSSEWSVSNSNIARLSAITKGELWGLKKGFVILKAQYKGMEATADVTVIPEPVPPPPNYAPKADFTISNPSPVEGEKVTLIDTSTHEGKKHGESIVSWEWNIEKIGSASEQNAEATWNEVGTYKITLRVEDQDGDSDSCTKSVVVGPALPAAVITTSADHIIIGREIHIDGDESTAAMGRDIKWDEMEWKFYNPNNALAYEYTGRYPLGKGTSEEKDLTNSVLNKTGNWKITLKVKDTNDNESEITERIIYIHPDNPPVADFWLASEAIRYSYQGYDLTVRDLSTAGTPDASLGDEIYERTWTLYYDANNDGNAQGSGDEVIRPGDKDKAAEIIQASINDSRPVIRFNKTGRYQLELAVKEHYEAWGEINEGLSDNTDNKTLADKNIMVINLAPTVAFDIKKKTPVDVLLAFKGTDCEPGFICTRRMA
ncbi:PKD domain-containing protein [Syntrophomonas zehnderi]|uniref:PKD domain-containing protein n=1 Tax=Syntrophomonas zehnderi TaxID=404335 RepID=UPI001A9A398A|nr:PKD domain-containing protein [Syntrophomonas zehnderi]